MRAPRLFWSIISLLAVSAGQLVAADTWLKLQTKDVIILSDASRRDVVEFAVGYAAYRHVFAETFSPKQPPPATVLLFRRLSKLEDYIPKSTRENSRMISFTANVDGDALIALAVDGDRHQALEQTYEFDTVWELSRIGYAIPVWMSQGAGEVLASLDIDKNKCRVGDGPSSYEITWNDKDPIAWPHFFEIGTESPEYVGRHADGTYHGQAWALMHWILLDDSKSIERFDELANKLHSVGGLEAVESTLHVSPKDLSATINRHLRHARTRDYVFDSEALRKQLEPVPAPPADVAVQLANLLFAAGKGAQAEQYLVQAKSLAPDAPAVKEALARQALRDNEPEYAIQLYRQAIAAGSTSPRAYLASAKQWLDDNSSGGRDREGDGGPNVDHALEDIRHALQLDPGNSYAYQLLGRAFFVSAKPTDEQVAELSPGITASETGAAVRYYRALLEHRLGQRDAYAADLHAIMADKGVSDGMRANARDQLVRDTLQATSKQLDALVAEQKFDDAAALIEQRQRDPDNAAYADMYAKMEKWLAESRALAEFKAAYDKHDWETARTIAKTFLEQYPRSRAAPSVRHTLMNLPTPAAGADTTSSPAAP